ncbi:amidohydrolase family protein [Saccharothrix variisporea]|uniref:Imidazolonepropionase-like amidohydrolase n=1 Tax=Saccharothrix variisporea TaxID=543527 RepID=A0A495X5C9_9PSEU|nr:amidohydrolase family protein [Saccharothrix variisporea]RKT69162.1 imidazolonepropionase-like amidohydrolase [Saccharothrix variisporea]
MRTLITDVRVFDGERTTSRANVLIDGDRLAEPDDRPVDVEVDGSGRTLLPGLVDAHTHTFDGSLAQALTFGVTTELDMFCLPGNLARQRESAAGHDDVADLRSAGTLATAPGGHPSQLMGGIDQADAFGGDAVGAFDTIADPGQAEAFVRARLAEGADYLKIVVDDGAVHGTRLPALAPETVTAVVEAAHAAGLMTIAHAITAREVAIALDAAVDGLAHVYADAEPEDPAGFELAERIAAQGVFVVTTLAYFEAISGQVGAVDHAHPGNLRNAVHAARVLHRAGVPLLAGTDANPFAPLHGAALHRELVLLTEAGLSAVEALAAATSVPARHFGLTDRGRIAPGLRADLVLVQGDPTRDVSATGEIVEVWRRGVRQARKSIVD